VGWAAAKAIGTRAAAGTVDPRQALNSPRRRHPGQASATTASRMLGHLPFVGWAPDAIPNLVMRGLDPRTHAASPLDSTVDVHGNGVDRAYWVYILASRPRGTLYVGVTNDLVRRVYLHRERLVAGFTKRYGIKLLVYYEQHATALAAIQREKNIKHWPRAWKIDLITSMNPDWYDLYEGIASWA
jgi:putative endonuclease